MQVPALIVTGALGAGKSTFIKNFVESFADGRTAILVNEFAQTGIDQGIFDLYGLPAIALTDGCICCATRGDVRRALQTLLFARARPSRAPIERIVLETSGLADPVALAEEFSVDLVLARRFRLAGILAVVDTTLPAEAISADRTITNQIAVADRVVLSKEDLENSNVGPVIAAVRSINEVAPVSPASKCVEEAHAVFAIDQPMMKPTFAAVAVSHADGLQEFASASFEDSSGAKLLSFAEEVVEALGPDLVRLKGLLHQTSGTGCIIIQAVRGRLYPSMQIFDRVLTGSSRLVAIARPAQMAAIVTRARGHGLAPLAPTTEGLA